MKNSKNMKKKNDRASANSIMLVALVVDRIHDDILFLYAVLIPRYLISRAQIYLQSRLSILFLVFFKSLVEKACSTLSLELFYILI